MNHITRDPYGLWLMVSPTIRQWAIIYSSKTGNQLIKSKSVQKREKGTWLGFEILAEA